MQPVQIGHRPTTDRRPWNDESRWRHGARQLGISFEAYRDQVVAGNRWCSGHRGWEPRENFGPHKRHGLDTRCRESSRSAAIRWNKQHRDGRGKA